MAAVGDILRRFRSLGVPGAPAAAAVPRDRSSARAAELAPVFVSLRRTEQRADRLVHDARVWSEAVRDAAATEAEEIRARARDRALQAGAAAASAHLATMGRRGDRLLEQARREAERTSAVSGPRIGALSDEVVRRVLAAAGAAPVQVSTEPPAAGERPNES